MAWVGEVGSGGERKGMAGGERLGVARSGSARTGTAGAEQMGMARSGMEGNGEVRNRRSGEAVRVKARCRWAWRGKERQE